MELDDDPDRFLRDPHCISRRERRSCLLWRNYIVQGINFEVAKGHVVALLGRNGAGKTSALRALRAPTLRNLQAGEIWLDGIAAHGVRDVEPR
jgi:ABC-type cobalamin/Fe3+-siderophores transport system ATPase subunit